MKNNFYDLIGEEKVLLSEIEKSFYMLPVIKRFQKIISQENGNLKAWRNLFDLIYNVLIESKNEVENILDKRKKEGKIKDIRQAMKSIAGHAFSSSIIYIFLNNKIIGNIKPEIFITSKKSQVKNFDEIVTINVDGETQKPDADLIIYSQKQNRVKSCIILSLKTSLRERAGQTYKWKLLMEIATSKNPIKDRYNISYKSKTMPLICFATANFYSEINNPQHKGMFKFFDKAFIAKPIKNNFISPLSEIVDFVNQAL